MGLPLTRQEAAEVSRRVAVQDAAGETANWAMDNASDFAGMWIDQSRRARLVFHVVGDAPDTRLGIASRVPDGSDYEVVAVARSWADLEAIKDRFVTEWDDLVAAGIPLISTAINTPSNTVLVGLKGRTPELEASLITKFGPGLSFREDSVAHPDACPWTQCLPAKGGIRMVSQQAANVCTTGFMGKVTSPSTYYVVVTAGHCFRAGGGLGEGDDWRHYQGTTMTKFGDAQKQTWYDNSGADVGLIKLTSTPSDRNNFVGHDVPVDIRSLTDRATNAEQAVGDYVCRMGGNLDSGYDCGNIINVAVDRESPIDGIGSNLILNQNEARFDSLPGDSGGSVYLLYTAYGTHTHSTDPDDVDHPRSWFTPIGRGESAYLSRWGVTYRLCLNDACSVTD